MVSWNLNTLRFVSVIVDPNHQLSNMTYAASCLQGLYKSSGFYPYKSPGFRLCLSPLTRTGSRSMDPQEFSAVPRNAVRFSVKKGQTPAPRYWQGRSFFVVCEHLLNYGLTFFPVFWCFLLLKLLSVSSVTLNTTRIHMYSTASCLSCLLPQLEDLWQPSCCMFFMLMEIQIQLGSISIIA